MATTYTKLSNDERKQNYINNVAELFIKGLERGDIAWLKPWEPSQTVTDFNMFSNKGKSVDKIKPYQGINTFITMLTRSMIYQSDDPRWLTFPQMNELNKDKKNTPEEIFIYKGSKGTTIQFFEFLYYKNGKKINVDELSHTPKKEEYDKCIPHTEYHCIFHASQFYKKCYDKDGKIILDKDGKPKTKPAFEPFVIDNKQIDFKPIKTAEQIINDSGAKIIYDQTDSCHYNPTDDCIHLVPKDTFKSIENYYSVVLHELGHWTGGEDKLNRVELKNYGKTKQYRAKEELNAQITSFMLCQKCNIAFKPTDNDISYINSWVSLLKDQPNAIFEACKNAQEAVSFLMNKVQTEQKTKTNESKITLTVTKARHKK